MAVAEDEKVERADKVERAAKGSGGDGEGPGGPLGYIPRKLGELRAFLTEVRGELKKVTWPSRQEVSATTVVVMATTVFFGFYLWGLDLVFSRILSQVLKR
jgi:preprotein translocase subunit SecE